MIWKFWTDCCPFLSHQAWISWLEPPVGPDISNSVGSEDLQSDGGVTVIVGFIRGLLVEPSVTS